MSVGVLHPGEMGSALGACLGEPAAWASEGRSHETRRRAEGAGFSDLGTVDRVAATCATVISVCPPANAVDVARQVADTGFDGLYVDANAVAPDTARRIGSMFARFVDASIIGPPPTSPGDTRLYLSGEEAGAVAELFAGSNSEPRVLGDEIGRASALKMAYAGWTKGSSALLLAIAAFATAEGIEDDLIQEWELSVPGTRERVEGIAGRIGAKAWRFGGEMDEIATAMTSSGLPDGFHRGAAVIYRRLADLKGEGSAQEVQAVLERILGGTS